MNPEEALQELRKQIKEKWSNYIQFTKDSFEDYHEEMTKDNHKSHNKDVEYQNSFINFIKNEKGSWQGKKALDFGCGCGRNIKNLLDLNIFAQVDGCDISKKNIEYSKKFAEADHPGKTHTWETNGYTLEPAPDNEYDFIMSHVVFQHIANWSIRYSLLTDIHRILKPSGTTVIHFMDLDNSVGYDADYPTPGHREGLYGLFNCRVDNARNIIEDFKDIGFSQVMVNVGTDPFSHKQSYYARGVK
mgnify:CR=1 FL=1